MLARTARRRMALMIKSGVVLHKYSLIPQATRITGGQKSKNAVSTWKKLTVVIQLVYEARNLQFREGVLIAPVPFWCEPW
jgi:hypothetical protein